MLCATLPSIACRDGIGGFGVAARARANSDQLFTAFADRHVDVARNAKYEYARVQLTRGAFSPSGVFEDTAAWTSTSGAVRMLETWGSLTDGKYVLTSQRGVTAPVKPADARHVTTLGRLSDNEYRWDTAVDFAVGSVRPSELATVIIRWLSAGEGKTGPQARADLASTMPRTAAALGSTFTLDSIQPTVLADGSTRVSLVMSVHSDRLRRRLPALGEYVHKYLDPARLRFVLTDRAGVPFFEAVGRDRVLTIRLRTQGGQLVPLTGAVRPLPDSLIVVADFAVKVRMFTVGFHDLSMEFFNTARGDSERDWAVVAKKEPKWNLPFITARLIRAPLRRPFAGEGALFRLGLRAGTGDQPTVLIRQSRLAVQESAILRFVNSLANTAMSDFGTRVEQEKNQWIRELFLAMRDDARAVLGP